MAKAAEHNDAWQTTNFRIAVNASVIESANRSQDEWANPEDRFSNAQLRQNPSRTRLLWDDEVQRLASIRLHDMAPSPPAFRGTRSSAPIDVGEDGTCDKCGGSHATEACPHYRRAGTHATRGWQASMWAHLIKRIRMIRDLHRYACDTPTEDGPNKGKRPAEDPGELTKGWPRVLVTNTGETGSSGNHWFTIIYSIRQRTVQGTPNAGATRSSRGSAVSSRSCPPT